MQKIRKVTKYYLISGIIILMLCLTLTGCGASGNGQWNGVSRQSFYFDTICELTIFGLEEGIWEGQNEEDFEASCETVISDAFKLMSDYEKTLSRTVEGSDIDKINKAGGEPVKVSKETIEVFKKGMEFGDVSDGVFDITVGKASVLWDFHESLEENEEAAIPDSDELAEAKEHIDYTKIEIDDEASTVQLKDPEMMLDLGGIAKGYIADRASEYLRSLGVTSGIVNLGGNIEVIGGKAPAFDAAQDAYEDFSLGIRDPRGEVSGLLGLYPAKDVTIVTSGTYERFIEVDGVRYHHILDPETGYPCDTDVIQVSVIADSGHSVDCDGLSTACLALGTEKGTELIRELDSSGVYGPLEAIFVDVEGNITYSNENTAFKAG